MMNPALRPAGYQLHYWPLMVFLMTLFTVPATYGVVQVTVDGNFKTRSLGQDLEYRIENGERLSPAAALAATDWISSDQDSLSFGFAPEPRWIRFNIRNTSPASQDLLVEITNPYLDQVDIYTLTMDGSIREHFQLGDQQPALTRPVLHSHFLAPFAVAGNSNLQMLIRTSTTSTHRIPINVWRQAHYITADYSRTLRKALLYGFFLAIGVYYLLLYFSVREKAYLYWSLSNIGMLCIVSSLDGVATALIWPSLTKASDYQILLGICSTIGFSALFSYEVLNLKEKPKPGAIMYLLVAFSLILAMASFIIPYQLVLKAGLLLGLGHAFVLTLVYFIRMIEGYKPARYVVAAILFACIGVVINILTVSGRLPSSALGANAAAIGGALAAIFYSLALSNRMNLDRSLREKAQLKLTYDLDRKVKQRSLELKQANEKLLQASITDALTGLFNRRHFDDVYDAEYRSAYRKKQSIALLMMDIDHFKKLNDQYGHTFGDICLQQTANSITSCLNRPPDICARYGGEEFIVVLPNTDLKGAVHVANIINQAVANSVISEGDKSISITISIGVAATIPGRPDDNSALLKQADSSLYRAKEQGRNRVAFG